jgi:hypothetical protein
VSTIGASERSALRADAPADAASFAGDDAIKFASPAPLLAALRDVEAMADSRTFASVARLEARVSAGDARIAQVEAQLAGARGLEGRMLAVWSTLKTPLRRRMEQLQRFAQPRLALCFRPALACLERAAVLVAKREALLHVIERFEATASDPRRFFVQPATVLLGEERQRGALVRLLSLFTRQLQRLAAALASAAEQPLLYRGAPYESRMRSDYFEMLYRLEERRRAGTSAAADDRVPLPLTKVGALRSPRAVAPQPPEAPDSPGMLVALRLGADAQPQLYIATPRPDQPGHFDLRRARDGDVASGAKPAPPTAAPPPRDRARFERRPRARVALALVSERQGGAPSAAV